MNSDQLQEWVKSNLGLFAKLKGHAVYSGTSTWKPGPYYLLGFNPAIDETNEHLDSLSTKSDSWSLYLDKCWHCGGAKTDCVAHSLKPHQKRVLEICSYLGSSPRAIFATNAIFAESRDAVSLPNATELWERCWQVHKRFLAVVQPAWIICLGNAESGSSFSLLKKKVAPNVIVSGDDFRAGKSFAAAIELGGRVLSVNVLGLPHPSRFPVSEGVRVKLRKIAQLTGSAD